jgi:hypothetical protein
MLKSIIQVAKVIIYALVVISIGLILKMIEMRRI